MTGPNGRNGSRPTSNVESLDEVRHSAAARKKQAAQGTRGAIERVTMRDWIIGGIFLALAIGSIVYWLRPVIRWIAGP